MQWFTVLFGPWYIEAIWTLFLSPILVFTYPMLIDKVYLYDFSNFEPASFAQICEYAWNYDWENFAFYLTMNENRFVAPIVYQIAYSLRNDDRYWDINRRDYLLYTFMLSLGKLLIYWIISPILLLMLPFLGYLVLNVYSFLYWFIIISHAIPDINVDIPFTLDIYRFYDYSNLLLLRADKLCPDDMIALPDGHCGCHDYQVKKGKMCLDICPYNKSLNKYDSAIFRILPECIDLYAFFDWYAQSSGLLSNSQ